MKLQLNECAKIGVSHHLLYKYAIYGPTDHLRTMKELLADPRPDVFDLWISEDDLCRDEEIRMIRDCGREVIYNIGDLAERPSLFPTARERSIREYTLAIFKGHLDRALQAGIRKTVTSSGMQHDLDDAASFDAICDFYCTLCEYVGPDMLIIVEPTDYNWDKRFYIGSSEKAMRLVRAVRDRGFANFSSMIDMCHLPLMFETIRQSAEALEGAIDHLHLGTCVPSDRFHPLFGDRHPAWGMPGTEWGKPELKQLYEQCLRNGYFSREHRGTASFEMIAYDKDHCLDSLTRFLQYAQEAWEEFMQEC